MPRLNIAAFVIDWDETISQNDTLSLLADCSPAASAQWSQFTSSYLSDLEAFQEAWEAEHGSRDTVDKQLQFLSDLEEVEQRSISRIEASNVFQGVTKDAIARAAKQAVVREGFKDFAEVAGSCYILSVHWSVHFIASALPEACRAWHIAANELEFQDGKCTGKVSKSGPDAFRTGIDKQRWLQRFRKEKKGLVVYIGDSNTDLPALRMLSAHE
jgi:2-hydroxy-3-keto-5-methylthiopentenyl-1-phosphate phosphatase